MSASMLASEQAMKVSNTTGGDIDLWIEPFGDRLPMAKGETVEIVATQELGHEVEIELSDDAIRVYGWIKRVSAVSSTGARTLLWQLPSS